MNSPEYLQFGCSKQPPRSTKASFFASIISIQGFLEIATAKQMFLGSKSALTAVAHSLRSVNYQNVHLSYQNVLVDVLQ